MKLETTVEKLIRQITGIEVIDKKTNVFDKLYLMRARDLAYMCVQIDQKFHINWDVFLSNLQEYTIEEIVKLLYMSLVD